MFVNFFFYNKHLELIGSAFKISNAGFRISNNTKTICLSEMLKCSEMYVSFYFVYKCNRLFLLFSRIRHFAGNVTYSTKDFVYKNYSSLPHALCQALYAANHVILRHMFPEGKFIFIFYYWQIIKKNSVTFCEKLYRKLGNFLGNVFQFLCCDDNASIVAYIHH